LSTTFLKFLHVLDNLNEKASNKARQIECCVYK